jgi:MoaA/NifB/PqqE/SkfB family radical SAM enzyme
MLSFADNFLVYGLKKKAKRSPMFISWDIAGGCNAKCSFCNRWSPSRTGEITTDEKLKVIREMGKIKPWFLSLCGGEPLLIKNFNEIISEIKKQKIVLNLSTNGQLLENYVDDILRSKVDFITISVDSHDPDKHNQERKLNDNFEKIKTVLTYIKKNKGKKTKVAVRSIIHKGNISEFDKYYQHWHPFVDDILLQPISTVEKLEFIPKDSWCEKLTESEIREFHRLLKKYSMFDTYNKGITEFINDRSSLAKKNRCYAGFFSLEIDYDGNVFNCGNHINKFGNLKNNSLLEIINGEDAQYVKKNWESRKDVCFCWSNFATLNYYISKITG